ncbi:restriction endonuclease subunit S [Gallicola sp. Sow4_E12]|uniref:restriction endonuclease subunit S n=1 Tax=Gallicola sp. Sow4_E12 TaxID=3438785 RepID=UPI003F90BD0B
MSEKKKLVPKRRFKEFENADPWEQRKLGEVARIIMGQSPEGNTYSETASDFILVQGNADMQNGWVIPRVWTSQVTKKAAAGDLIMSVRAPAGSMGKTAFNVVIGRGVAAIKGNEFLYQLLVNLDSNGYWKTISTGSTFESLSSGDIINALIKIPKIEEQSIIGELFYKLDTQITLHQRKLDKLKNLKSAYLSEMFPAEGERKPKRRFAGFTDDWEQRKVESLFKITRGYVLAADKTSLRKTKTMKYPVYSSQTLNNGLLGYYNEFLFEKAITWTTDGANAGTVCYRNEKFYSTNVNGVLISKVGYSCKAVAESLNLVAWKYVTKVGNPKLMNNTMSNINLMVPIDLEELDRISKFFAYIDNQITLHQRKLEKLQNIKKAYLNEMFI